MRNNNLNNKTILLINVILLQVLIVMINAMWSYYCAHLPIDITLQQVTTFSLAAGVILAITSIWLIKEIYRLAQKEAEADLSQLRIKESRELIDILRIHRHDFLNHIQVVYGLAQMGKLDRLKSYINQITSGMEAESNLSKLAHPELAAFLIKKANLASGEGVKISYRIETDLLYFDMAASDVISVMGNLLDNALYAVKQAEGIDPRIMVVLGEDDASYRITVCNNGSPIDENIRGRIFEKGFSTKKGTGSGLGLFIVNKIVTQYGGTLKLSDYQEFETCFVITVPKRRKEKNLSAI